MGLLLLDTESLCLLILEANPRAAFQDSQGNKKQLKSYPTAWLQTKLSFYGLSMLLWPATLLQATCHGLVSQKKTFTIAKARKDLSLLCLQVALPSLASPVASKIPSLQLSQLGKSTLYIPTHTHTHILHEMLHLWYSYSGLLYWAIKTSAIFTLKAL